LNIEIASVDLFTRTNTGAAHIQGINLSLHCNLRKPSGGAFIKKNPLKPTKEQL